MEVQRRRQILSAVSRRALLRGAAAFTAVRPVPAFQSGEGPFLAYVGTYTDRGKGIYLFRMNRSTGALTQVKTFENTPSPSALALHPFGTYLYAANEISNFNGTRTGSVSAFAINRSNGDLTPLNVVSSQGGGPAHLSVHPSGRYVLVSNYGGGNVAVLPIQSNGGLGDATDVQNHVGPLGPRRAVYAWPGSFAISGHDAPHAHMIESDLTGRFVLSTDLGTDRIFIWKFDAMNGKLIPNDTPFAQAIPGAGPRHLSFHPNGRWVYTVNEEDSTLTFFGYDPERGFLQPRHTVPTLPDNFAGTNFTSEIMVFGKYVYTANRLYDTIAIFEIDPTTGDVTRVGDEWTRGSYPRNFAIDPTGSYMHVLNQRSDNAATFRLEDGGRKLTFTGQFTPIGNPSSMVFLT